MAKDMYPVPKSNPNAMFVLAFLVTWVASAIVIGLANFFMPESFVLGTVNIPYTSALLLSSGVLAWITTMCIPLFTQFEIQQQRVLQPQHWMAGYLVINAIALWVIARQAEIVGLGISSWTMVLILAIVLDVVQGMAQMALGQATKK